MKLTKKTKMWLIPVLIIAILGVGVGAGFGFAIIPYKGTKSNEIWRSNVQFKESDYEKTLDMGDKDEFVILNLADIQIEDLKPHMHKPTFEMLTKLIEKTNPDLITLTGDQVSGPYVRSTLKKICKFIDGFDIPWAPVLGNHDGEWNLTRNGNGDFYQNGGYKNVIFRKNDPALGVGNYIINVAKNGQSVHTLFMIDSHNEREYDSGTDYDYIWYSQIAWYEWAINGIKDLNGGNVIPSSCFFHIALPEYVTAYEGYEEGIYEGGNVNRETICCVEHKNKENPYNSGFYQKMQDLGSTKLVMVGHDHANCSWVNYNGIVLSYGLKSGYGSYYDNDLIGGTTVTIKKDGTTSLNYYRYLDGEIKLDNNITEKARNKGKK